MLDADCSIETWGNRIADASVFFKVADAEAHGRPDNQMLQCCVFLPQETSRLNAGVHSNRLEVGVGSPTVCAGAGLLPRNTEDERKMLIPQPAGEIQRGGSGPRRLLSRMTDDVLDIVRSRAVLGARFRIGQFEFREPDYRQIQIWAECLGLSADAIVRRLTASTYGEQGNQWTIIGRTDPCARCVDSISTRGTSQTATLLSVTLGSNRIEKGSASEQYGKKERYSR